MIHHPLHVGPAGIGASWKQMEALKDEGLTKSIGVSNFRVQHLNEVLAVAKYKPAANQVSMCESIQDENLFNNE